MNRKISYLFVVGFATLLAGCVTYLTSSSGLYPDDPSQLSLVNTDHQTVRRDQVRHSIEDVEFALKRAINIQGGSIDFEKPHHFTGLAGIPAPETTCGTAQVSFAAYFREIDSKPTTEFILVVNHRGQCASSSLFGNPRNDEFAQSVGSSFYSILSTYE